MKTLFSVTRRDFLGGLVSASALVIGARLLPVELLAQSAADGAAWSPSVYLGIETDGRVIIVAHRSEMGTGIRTALPMVVAEELEADWNRVTIDQAIGDPRYGDQNTDGSRSVRQFYEPMRRAGAAARMLLETAAANTWGVPVTEVRAQNHIVVHEASNRQIGFGELVAAASRLPLPDETVLQYKPESEYRYVGQDIAITDLDDIVRGAATFGQDVRVPGMVYASIERPPVFGGRLRTVDDSRTRQVPGVVNTAIIKPQTPPYGFQALGGVAVLADNTWAAMQGRRQLQLDWDLGPHATHDSAAYRREMEATVRQPGQILRDEGNVDEGFAAAVRIHDASYYTPQLAHAPMEPPAAVADVRGGEATVWTCTQNPQAVQATVAEALGLNPDNVTCYVTLLGGGFGRKSKPDYCTEAALLSRQLNQPVKVVWSREDDIHFDYFHSPAAVYMRAGVDARGLPVAWLQRTVFPPIGSQRDESATFGGGMGFSDVPFDIPNLRVENGPALAHTRIGWLRSVANIYHAFAIHSFADELAAAAERDPVDYVLDLLGEPRLVDFRPEEQRGEPDPYMLDIGRARRVLEQVAEQSGWVNRTSGGGRGYGVAVHRSFRSYIAAVVEVDVDDAGNVTVGRVDYAVDAGKIIHPDRVRAQFEGAAVFGVGVALLNEITCANGQIEQANFDTYRIARMSHAPRETNVTIVGTEHLPTGVGEPGVPPIAPAICNAVYAATGTRVRELPLRPERVIG